MQVSTPVLSAVLGLSTVHLGRLATDGTVSKTKRGKYDLCRSVQGYLQHLRKTMEEESREVSPHVLSLAEAKTREHLARAKAVETRNREIAGDLVEITQAVKVLSKFCAAARERVLRSALDTQEKREVLNDLAGLLEAAGHLHERNGNSRADAGVSKGSGTASGDDLPGVGGPKSVPLP